MFKIDSESDSDDTPLLFDSPQHHSSLSMSCLDNNPHCHTLVQNRQHANQAKRKLTIALGLCLLFISGEVVGAYLSGSLAIMSDAAHMFSDFASFVISLLAIHLGSRSPSKKFTFGLLRAEALGALFTVMIIWFASGVLLFLAIHRLQSGDFQVEPDPMIAVATCAVIFNIVLGLLLNGVPHSHGHSHGGNKHSHLEGDEKHINLRAAVIHVLGKYFRLLPCNLVHICTYLGVLLKIEKTFTQELKKMKYVSSFSFFWFVSYFLGFCNFATIYFRIWIK